MEAKDTLAHLAPRAQFYFEQSAYADQEFQWCVFAQRLHDHWPALFAHLKRLYGDTEDFFPLLEQTLLALGQAFLQRPRELRILDEQRLHRPDWIEDPVMVGGILTIDPAIEDLSGLAEKLPYFKEMGITLLHLTPLLQYQADEAIGRHPAVRPCTVADLQETASLLREEGVSLAVDFAYQNSADKQPIDNRFDGFYHLLPNRRIPDAYDLPLAGLFPGFRSGCFLWNQSMNKWVWTGFSDHPWQGEHAAPLVFKAMLEEMLFLANIGVEVLCLDPAMLSGTDPAAAPFASLLMQSLQEAARIVAPSLLMYSCSFVPADSAPTNHADPAGCRLSANPLLTALLWEAAATRDVRLFVKALTRGQQLPRGCNWCNLLRCPDEVRWSFDDADAQALGIVGGEHRRFLNQFYSGRFPGSYARGLPYRIPGEDREIGICGTFASLAGLEQALEFRSEPLQEMAVKRMLLLYSVLVSIGGIPMIYLGEEWGMLSNHAARQQALDKGDCRPIHRLRLDWQAFEGSYGPDTIQGRLHRLIVELIRLRKTIPALAGTQLQLLPMADSALLAYLRHHNGHRLLVLCNFCEEPVTVDARELAGFWTDEAFVDLISDRTLDPTNGLQLAPYEYLWLKPA